MKYVIGIAVAALVLCGCGSNHSKSVASATTIAAAATSSSTTRGPASGSPEKKPHAKAARTATSSAGSTSTTHVTTPTTPATTPPTPATTPPTVAAANHVSDAVALVRSQGYTPRGTADFSSPPAGGLHVIVATATGSADGHTQRAFFFVDGRYIRADADPSASIRIAWRNNDTIALAYAIYKAGEPVCCPTGGSMIVRYQWTGSRIDALDPVPSHTDRR